MAEKDEVRDLDWKKPDLSLQRIVLWFGTVILATSGISMTVCMPEMYECVNHKVTRED